jgi:hypothetical protein
LGLPNAGHIKWLTASNRIEKDECGTQIGWMMA